MTDAMKMGVETKKLEVYCPVCNCGVGFALTEGSVLVKFLEHMQRKHPLHCSCGIFLEGHRRCRACGIYLGSGHLEVASEIREDNTFCHDCAKFYDKNPAEIRQYHFGPFKWERN